jgi:hypothetical protein
MQKAFSTPYAQGDAHHIERRRDLAALDPRRQVGHHQHPHDREGGDLQHPASVAQAANVRMVAECASADASGIT